MNVRKTRAKKANGPCLQPRSQTVRKLLRKGSIRSEASEETEVGMRSQRSGSEPAAARPARSWVRASTSQAHSSITTFSTGSLKRSYKQICLFARGTRPSKRAETWRQTLLPTRAHRYMRTPPRRIPHSLLLHFGTPTKSSTIFSYFVHTHAHSHTCTDVHTRQHQACLSVAVDTRCLLN